MLLAAVDEQSGHLVGYVHAEVYDCLYHAPLLNLLALAVGKSYQGQGFGRALLTELEKIAQARGFAGIRVNSGVARQDAHAFYRSCAYEERPDQKRFLRLF